MTDNGKMGGAHSSGRVAKSCGWRARWLPWFSAGCFLQYGKKLYTGNGITYRYAHVKPDGDDYYEVREPGFCAKQGEPMATYAYRFDDNGRFIISHNVDNRKHHHLPIHGYIVREVQSASMMGKKEEEEEEEEEARVSGDAANHASPITRKEEEEEEEVHVSADTGDAEAKAWFVNGAMRKYTCIHADGEQLPTYIAKVFTPRFSHKTTFWQMCNLFMITFYDTKIARVYQSPYREPCYTWSFRPDASPNDPPVMVLKRTSESCSGGEPLGRIFVNADRTFTAPNKFQLNKYTEEIDYSVTTGGKRRRTMRRRPRRKIKASRKGR